MLRIAAAFAVLVLALLAVERADESAITYYVQLVRGNDSDQPPQPGSSRVGAKLARTFNEVFKWKNYWELCRRRVELVPGQSRRVALGNDREVEIELTPQGRRTVTAFENGKQVG